MYIYIYTYIYIYIYSLESATSTIEAARIMQFRAIRQMLKVY